MASQTSLIAEKTRLREWALQIQDCQNRPVDMDVATWCAEHNITRANYYYRLRRVRQAFLDTASTDDIPTFVELPVSSQEIPSDKDSDRVMLPAATITLNSGITLAVSDQASESFLRNLIQAANLC